MSDRFDVAIVGLGPVGATLAALLGNAGLRVGIFDRELGIYDKPRAIVLDHEALRVLQQCGIDRGFFDTVFPHTGTDFLGLDGQLIKLFDPKAPPFELGHAPNVMFIQPEFEVALAERLAALPTVEARRGVELSGLKEDKAGVTLTLTQRDGSVEEMRASWVVGADGANSFVRRAAAMPLEDMDFAEWWVVVDAWLTRDTPLPAKTTQFCRPTRPATFVVGPRTLRRWEIKLLPGEDPERYRDPTQVERLLADFVDTGAIDIWRSAVYRFQAVVAERWSRGRLLIAGDAAHTMPPFLAQGLCAGIRDAANLAWKLEQIVKHGAPASLLDSYEVERKPHVSQVIRHAKAFGLIIGELDPGRAAARDAELGEQLRAGTAPTVRQAFIPDLDHGLIDRASPGAGSQVVQPMVAEPGGGMALLDDVVGPGFLIASADDAVQRALPADLIARWHGIGGRQVLVGDAAPDNGPILRVRDGEMLFAAWLARTGATVAVIRPDHYVYGTAADPAGLQRLVEGVLAAVAPVRSPPSEAD